MAGAIKRKAITHDSPEADEVALSDGGAGFENGLLDGVLSQSEDEDGDDIESADVSVIEDGEEGLFDEDDLDTDEISSDEDKEDQNGVRNGSRQENGDAQAEDGLTINYEVVEDANGNPRYLYRDIDPVYDSDDSDAKVPTNTIGNIPLSFYDSYPHIGYDINGRKIARPAKGEALDALLDSIEVPKGWTGLTDPATGKPLELSQQELEVLKKIQMDEVPEEGFDPYPPTIEYFTSKTETMPLSAAPEPKRRFIPSKHEAKRVMKIVRAIREGRILPYKPPAEEEEEGQNIKRYDIWANETPRPDHPMNIPAPKLPPPGFDQSYHPPPEYLPDQAEKKAWEEADEEDRDKEYLPNNHDSLRKVPGYEKFIKEKFERCLDLYLAPRVRRSKLNIDPESLLPKLPSPEELRPFPTTCATTFNGHEGRVRSVSIDPSGYWLASGGDDGTVRMWNLNNGSQIYLAKLSSSEAVNVVCWRPGTDAHIICAATGESVYFIAPLPTNSETDPEADSKSETQIDTSPHSRSVLEAGFSHVKTTAKPSKPSLATWSRPPSSLRSSFVILHLSLPSSHPIKTISFHRRGDYFSTVTPQSSTSSAVAIHTLSTHTTQLPFRHLKGGLPQTAIFHPNQPLFFLATQRSIRVYNLSSQTLHKTLLPGAKWISSIDLHPTGDHLLVSSYDRRLLWHDLDLSPRPYKTLRYHQKAIRAVSFHKGGFPLFADASDDGTLQVFHAKVVSDALENATIVPLKVLRGHRVVKELGVLDLDWHGQHPWLVSAGADGVCKLWV
ncbi:Ribosome biogenesis protein erb1 [Loxospora ochrophaea]|nr:Ribosome biogenesis protein erb1 [Loxospora ochrophaea]